MVTARDNPFATARVEALLRYDPRWIGESWEAIEARLDRLGRRGAVVGPHGSGKTTFIEALAARLTAAGSEVETVFLNRQSPLPPVRELAAALPRDAVVLFDGAEQLGARAWRCFLGVTSHLGGLLVTAHRPGRLPTLLETAVAPEILLRCIRRLDPCFAIDRRGAEALFRRHRGNLRHALLECYDVAAASAVI